MNVRSRGARPSCVLPCARAGLAPPAQRDLVVVHPETGGGNLIQVARAGMDLKNPSTEGAVEVVVVAATRGLVPIGLAGEGDGLKPALLDKSRYGPINCGEPHSGDILAREGEGFGGAQGAIGAPEGGLDRLALAGAADHRVSVGGGGAVPGGSGGATVRAGCGCVALTLSGSDRVSFPGEPLARPARPGSEHGGFDAAPRGRQGSPVDRVGRRACRLAEMRSCTMASAVS